MKDITTEEAIKILEELSTFDYVKLENGDVAIEKVLDELENEKEYHQWDAKKLQDYHKENSELNTKCVQLEYQLEKKDKIINAMAELIEECRQNDCLESEDVDLSQIAGVKAIKQYFEQEAKNE